jgi:hypothetical protein
MIQAVALRSQSGVGYKAEKYYKPRYEVRKVARYVIAGTS